MKYIMTGSRIHVRDENDRSVASFSGNIVMMSYIRAFNEILITSKFLDLMLWFNPDFDTWEVLE